MKRHGILPISAVALGIILNVVTACSQSLQSALAGKIDIVVAAYGPGGSTDVQDAVAAVPDNNPVRKAIFLEKGTYREKPTVPWKKTHITLVANSGFGPGNLLLPGGILTEPLFMER